MPLKIEPKTEIYLRLAINDIRPSHFTELMSNNLFAIEQTMPLIENHAINSLVLITYCMDGTNNRLGIEARIESITPDYRIILRKLSEPVTCDLRICPRIRLDLLPGVRAFCHDKEIQVVDVSGGGAHMILRGRDCEAPEIGAIVQMKFIFENGEANVDSEILRKWSDLTDKTHVAVKFISQNDIQKLIY